MTKPRFLFIGPSKSGSTWLFEVLYAHPSVFLPVAKDTFYFNREHARGDDWYESFFKACRPDQVPGEICHDYLASAQAIARIAQYDKTMKLMVCLRDPFDRAWSSYRFFQRNGMDLGSLATQAEAHPEIFEEGFYHRHLSLVLAHFPREQVLVKLYDDMLADPAAFARDVFDFIGVQPIDVPVIHQRVNAQARPRSPLMAQMVKQAALAVRSMGLPTLVGMIKRHPMVRRALYVESKGEESTVDRAQFPPAIIAALNADIMALGRMIDRDLSSWLAPQP
jgi:Sulfotransferase domain